MNYKAPLEAYYRHDGSDWVPCYVRGTGPTEELARLHAEKIRAEERFKIAWQLHDGEECPYRLSREVR